ncbi:U-box domain-containing protein [Legionella spiritensis]|uniref:Ras family GTPase n=1 Tax=Legionella spiritensis TaxID=452 RepID=A0A0W0Z5P1_LEGSP|nr:U-box domain-containing protein [Legionella spiritensis]KTD64038.1 Ras family GTPase [Legionella spiritensis]SNV37347.1 Ras family GTPase [Legionella spiritensis]
MPTIYIDNTADVKKYEKAINYILDTIDAKKIEEYVCPVSSEFMSEPMFMPGEDKYCYDKSSLEEWFTKQNTHPYTRKILTGNPIEHFKVNDPLQRFIFKFLNKKLAKLHDEKPELFTSSDKIAAEEVSLDSDKGKERIEIEEEIIDYDTSATSSVETEDMAVATPFNSAAHTPDMLEVFDITPVDYHDIINRVITLDDASIMDACETDENTAVCVLLTPVLMEKITRDQAETLRDIHEKVQTAFALIPALQTETSVDATRKTPTVVGSTKKVPHTRTSPPVKHEVRVPARSFFEPAATTPPHVDYSTYSPPTHSSSDEVELHKINVLLLGDSGVGKSCCTLRYLDETFVNCFISPTIDFGYRKKQIITHEKAAQLSIFEHNETSFMNYDGLFENASVAMVVFDVSDKTSFINVSRHLSVVERYGPPMPVLLLANKADLKAERVIRSEEIKEFVDKFGLTYFETSARTGENISEAFAKAAEQTLIKRGIIEMPKETVPEEGPSTPSPAFYKRFFKKSPKAADSYPPKPPTKEAFNQIMPNVFPVTDTTDIRHVKIMMFSDYAGASSVARKYVNGTFTGDFFRPGTDFQLKKILIHDKPLCLQLWPFMRTDVAYRRGIHVAVVVIDVTERKNVISDIMEQVSRWTGASTTKILLANKTDMVSKRVISSEDIKALAEKYGFDAYYETSAKTGKNIDLAFTKAAEYHLIKHGYIEKPYEDEKEQADKRCVIC